MFNIICKERRQIKITKKNQPSSDVDYNDIIHLHIHTVLGVLSLVILFYHSLYNRKTHQTQCLFGYLDFKNKIINNW